MKVFNARRVARGDAFLHKGHPYIRINDDSGRVYDLSTGMICRLKNFPDDQPVEVVDVTFKFKVKR